MTYDEWRAAGTPLWVCEKCKGIMVTIPPTDDGVCPLCRDLGDDAPVIDRPPSWFVPEAK